MVRKHWAAEAARVQIELAHFDLAADKKEELSKRLDLLKTTGLELLSRPLGPAIAIAMERDARKSRQQATANERFPAVSLFPKRKHGKEVAGSSSGLENLRHGVPEMDQRHAARLAAGVRNSFPSQSTFSAHNMAMSVCAPPKCQRS